MKKLILTLSTVGFFLLGLSCRAHAGTLPAQNENSGNPDLSDAYSDPFQGFTSAWNPDAEMERVERNMQRMMRLASSMTPGSFTNSESYPLQSEFKDLGKEYRLQLRLPGMEKEKIDIETTGRQIKISGRQNVENKIQDERSQRIEKSQSLFQQTLLMPEDADEASIQADYHQDILTVHLSKLSPTRFNSKPERTVAVK